MGGIVSGIVNAAKSIWNTVKSFANDCWQTTTYYAQKAYQAVSHVVNTIKEVYYTSINGIIVEGVREVKLAASKMTEIISNALNNCKLLLSAGLEKFLSVYLTAKMIFGKILDLIFNNSTQQLPVIPVEEPVRNEIREERQDIIIDINPIIDNNHNFDNEIKEKELDRSKGFLEDVKSYIREMENFKGPEYPHKKPFSYQFTLEGAISIERRNNDENNNNNNNENNNIINDNNNNIIN